MIDITRFNGEQLVLIHENGQSPYNYDVDPTEFKSFGRNRRYQAIIGQQIVTQSLKKHTKNCLEDNSNKQSHCINNFFNKKLGCNLPWSKSIDGKQGVR